MPLSRFLICDFSSWQLTTVLVGMCVIRTAEYVVLTDWPPGPEEQNVSIRKSLASILISTSSASGRTATVTAEVCTRPCCSVAGSSCCRRSTLFYLCREKETRFVLRGLSFIITPPAHTGA